MKRKPRVVYSAHVTPAIRAKCVLGSVSENKLEPTVEIPKEGGGGWGLGNEASYALDMCSHFDFALKQKSHQQLSGVSASPNRVFCEVSGLTA
ncbi:Calcineurin subunit B type 1 [Dissostichus eleginoides]|uniref:Calcineurin subunit B type 1 n=1 Tax=Dissostichus eleginoides TaxID=100907 RepID=A0AAD9BNW7_DISEL|nr:Calcineurin subunit B type 1 [Dissostichus eleginoides]